MKITVPATKAVDVAHILLRLPVRYGEEDIPRNFPGRDEDTLVLIVDLATGKIDGWPVGRTGSVKMKVCDEGIYILFNAEEEEVARVEYYAPHGVVPGEYGDYVNLEINADGVITNWPKEPDLGAFFNPA